MVFLVSSWLILRLQKLAWSCIVDVNYQDFCVLMHSFGLITNVDLSVVANS